MTAGVDIGLPAHYFWPHFEIRPGQCYNENSLFHNCWIFYTVSPFGLQHFFSCLGFRIFCVFSNMNLKLSFSHGVSRGWCNGWFVVWMIRATNLSPSAPMRPYVSIAAPWLIHNPHEIFDSDSKSTCFEAVRPWLIAQSWEAMTSMCVKSHAGSELSPMVCSNCAARHPAPSFRTWRRVVGVDYDDDTDECGVTI